MRSRIRIYKEVKDPSDSDGSSALTKDPSKENHSVQTGSYTINNNDYGKVINLTSVAKDRARITGTQYILATQSGKIPRNSDFRKRLQEALADDSPELVGVFENEDKNR